MKPSRKGRARKASRRRVCAVDLFCGAGGLTNGLERAGIDVRLGIDVDPACSFPYAANNRAKFLLKAVEDIKVKELAAILPKSRLCLLAGCAPCQTFSTYYQKASRSDKRWRLLLEFSRLIEGLGPELVTMENVPGLMRHDVFDDFVESLDRSGYDVCYEVVDCSAYGVPQHRYRMVLLASRLGPIELLTPVAVRRCPVTVRKAIGRLSPIGAGEVCRRDSLHQSSTLSDLNLRRIKTSVPNGTWRDWSEDLVADCHKRETGRTYPGVYGRMCWEEPAPTITTQFYGFGNGRFGHPEQNRAISLREGAILQGFPKGYEFVPPGQPINKKRVGRLIGNAVPPTLGEIIGLSILRHVSVNAKPGERLKPGARARVS